MITFRPYGGLANRMRSIAASVFLGKQLNQSVRVIWVANKELQSSFTDLFEPNNRFQLIENPWLDVIRYPYWYQPYRRLKKYINAERIGSLFYDKYLYEPVTITDDQIDSMQKCESIYITSCYAFTHQAAIRTLFVPNADIQKEIDSHLGRLGKNAIGVHIRRGDHAQAIQASPLDLFIDKMRTLVEDDPLRRFFLATDSPETEQELRQLFGDKIYTIEKVSNRSTKEGMKGALIDMYCLANTKSIIGSPHSSFSEIAASINQIPLETLQLVTQAAVAS